MTYIHDFDKNPRNIYAYPNDENLTPCGWYEYAREKRPDLIQGKPLLGPKQMFGEEPDAVFSWENYLDERNAMPLPFELFSSVNQFA